MDPVDTKPPAPPARQEKPVVDTSARAAIRVIAEALQNGVASHPGQEGLHKALDQVRIDMGDEDHEVHVLLRTHAQLEREHDSMPGDDPRAGKLGKRVEKARQAIEEHEGASARFEEIANDRKSQKHAASTAAAEEE